MAVPELLTLEVSLVIALLAFLIGLGYPLLASRRYACIFLIAMLFHEAVLVPHYSRAVLTKSMSAACTSSKRPWKK